MKTDIAARHAEILALIAQGLTWPEASVALGIRRVSLFKYCKRFGLSFKKAIADPDVVDRGQISEAVQANQKLPAKSRLSNDDLAKKLGIGVTLLKKMKKNLGLRFSSDELLRYTVDDLKSASQLLGFSIVDEPRRVVTNEKVVAKCFCGREFTTLTDSILRGNVNSCGCIVSKPQADLRDFLKSKGFDVQWEEKTLIPGEYIDIYVPEKKLAVEYCGLYWHGEARIGRSYHHRRWKALRDQGVRLLTIFEDEWLENRDLVLSVLEAKLGLIEKQVGARECGIIDDRARIREFMAANHLQGASGGVHLGLEKDGVIVAAIAFKKNNRLSLTGWELARFCVLRGCSAPGGFSRLLAEFVRRHQPLEVVSLSDNRWSDGGLYERNGFELLRESGPNYYYFKNRRRMYKYQFSLRRLKAMGWYVEGLSESQICASRGLEKIWDCGKKTWRWAPAL